MRHDQIFKDLLQAFLPEFIELFFPDVAARLDFSRVEFLSEEIFTDRPEGDPRRVDVVARVRTADGQPELICIHVEVQASREAEFGFRMWEYYSLLRFRYRMPILPIALFLVPGVGGLTDHTYTESLWDEEVLRFRYRAVGLPDLPGGEYRERENPLGPALAALMRVPRRHRAEHKAKCLDKLVEGQDKLGRLRQRMLVGLVDRYLPLSHTEGETFRRIMRTEEFTEARMLLTTWEEQGIIKGKQDAARRIAHARFGDAAERLEALINAAESEADTDVLIDQLLAAESVEELQPHKE